MDLAPHALPERAVDDLVPRHAALAGELRGDHHRLKVYVVGGADIDARAGQHAANEIGDLLRVHEALWRTDTVGIRAGNTKEYSMASALLIETPDAQLIAAGRRALELETQALAALGPRLDAQFAAACRLCLACRGRIVVTGMGKSGHIGGKIAATLASTGTPAFFLHPAEASHGDIGMITRDDVLLAISNSGETVEIVTLLPHLKRLGTALIAMTGKPRSLLAREARVNLDVSVAEEACPLNLAPTASTTATLAMGDALAVALLDARGFTAQDFARSHPGGSLGRRLLVHVEDVMRSTREALPRIAPDASVREGLLEMSRKGLGFTTVVDADDLVLGIFTDGDLRRRLDQPIDLARTTMREVMTSGGKSIGPRELAAEAVHLMETYRITALPVVDAAGRLIGALNVHDLFRAGVV
jgi:arabinose-5-phosphate isomerase